MRKILLYSSFCCSNLHGLKGLIRKPLDVFLANVKNVVIAKKKVTIDFYQNQKSL